LRWAERLSAGAQEAQHTKVAKVEEEGREKKRTDLLVAFPI
jgi:hypothetical protein